MYLACLGNEWLPAIPDVDRRLRAARRRGWPTWPAGWGGRASRSHGPTHWSRWRVSTSTPAAIASAVDTAAAEGLADRLSFTVADAADPGLSGRFDLVTILEGLHDMARPVQALRAVRAMLADGGSVLIIDERVADAFAAPADDLERYHYAWSVVGCLPGAMGDPETAATGAVMRVDTLRRYAAQAGFRSVEVLPIETPAWRFYRLDPELQHYTSPASAFTAYYSSTLFQVGSDCLSLESTDVGCRCRGVEMRKVPSELG